MYRLGFNNPWVASVDRARRRLPAWAAAGIGLALVPICVAGGSVMARAVLTAPSGAAGGAIGPARAATHQAVLFASVFGPLLLTAVVLGKWIEGRPRPAGWSLLPALGLGAAVGLCGFCSVLMLVALAGSLTTGHGAPTGAAAAAGVAAGMMFFAFQTGAEEIFFRGWLQPLLCARWGPWAGLLATALLFALAHWIARPWGALASIDLLLAGLLFGLLALRTGGLWAPFAAHWAWNAAETSGFGLEPNPGLSPLGAVVDFELSGPTLWTGGRDALNGSLASTLVLGALVIAFAAWGPRRPAPG